MDAYLLIHGFTGGPWEVEPLACALRSRGDVVETPLIAGHGRTKKQMKKASAKEYIDSIENVCKTMMQTCSRIHVIGFSMGGLIGIHLANKYPKHIASLCLLAPPVFPIDMTNTLKTLVQKKYLMNYIYKFFKTPLHATKQFQSIVKQSREDLKRLQQPLLVLQGERDHLVSFKSAVYIMNHVKSQQKRVEYFSKSGHLLLHEGDKEEIIQTIFAWNK